MNKYSIRIICIVALAGSIACSQMKAQHLEITPFAGWETGGKIYTSLGYLRIDGGMNFGGAISYGGIEDFQLEFTYNHMNSELSLDDGEHITNRTAVNVDYYMLGVIRETRLGERFLPYAGGALGLVHYGLPDENSDEVLMSVHVSGGFKVLITEWLGIRVQARLLMPLFYQGAYFSYGTSGTGYGVTSTCVMVQGDFTGGLFFVID